MANAIYLTGASTASIVASIDVADGAQTLLQTTLKHARNLTVTITDANASLSAGICTIVGTDINGAALSEAFTLPVDGTATVTGTSEFKTITSATVSSLAGEEAGDKITIGEGNTYQIETDQVDLKSITIGETSAGAITIIDGTSGSTANIATLKASIAEQTFEFCVTCASGLRIIMAGASKITVVIN